MADEARAGGTEMERIGEWRRRKSGDAVGGGRIWKGSEGEERERHGHGVGLGSV